MNEALLVRVGSSDRGLRLRAEPWSGGAGDASHSVDQPKCSSIRLHGQARLWIPGDPPVAVWLDPVRLEPAASVARAGSFAEWRRAISSWLTSFFAARIARWQWRWSS